MLGGLIDTDMQNPVSFAEKIEYKKQFIKKFGEKRWKEVHEGVPFTYTDERGSLVVSQRIPELPTEVYQWIKANGWTLQLYVQSVVGESNDIGSNIAYNSATASAAFKNTVTDVKESVIGTLTTIKRRLIIGGVAVAGLGLVYLFRAELFSAAKAKIKGRK